MTTIRLLPFAFFTLFVSNVFAQACPPPLSKSQNCVVIDSLTFEKTYSGSDCSAVNVYPSGGAPPYTYEGGPDQQGWALTSNYIACSEGQHCIVVTDATGCSAVSCFLHQRLATGGVLQIDSIDYKAALCGGDCEAAMVYVSGGAAPYEFNWSDATQSNNGYYEYCSGGEYAVTVTDADGSVVVDSFEIVEYPELLIESPLTAVNCDGLEISVVGTGGVPPYEYSLNGGEFDTISEYNDLTAGMYTVLVRDSVGCTETVETPFLQFSPLEVSISVSGNTATANVSGGTQPYAYEWSGNGNTTATTTGLGTGTHCVTVTDSNGCDVIEKVDVMVGIETPEYLTNFDIFPNPSKGKFMIDLQFDIAQTTTIQVLNSLGQEVYHFIGTQSHFRQIIDIHDVEAGTYFMVISTESGQVVRRLVFLN